MMAGILFVGVTTGSSLVHRARPAWQPLLGQACSLRGADIPLGADDETYLSLLDGLRRDNGVAGAVVTTHKVRLLRAGRARFAWLDPLALACQEVNAIRRAGGGLRGWDGQGPARLTSDQPGAIPVASGDLGAELPG
jgi:shikimate 5-dehydrogenase